MAGTTEKQRLGHLVGACTQQCLREVPSSFNDTAGLSSETLVGQD